MRQLILLSALIALPGPARADYQPVAEPLADNVYAIVGPLGQRAADNDGLNANYGFVVTDEGVILIDSGASRLGAEKLQAAVAQVTDRPIRWVINTGSQDHRWLGNPSFAARGAEVIALARTAEAQGQYGPQQLQSLASFLGERLEGTQALPATRTLAGDEATLSLGGETLVLRYTDAHFPGDAWVWLPERGVLFTGDLVYVDRLLGVLPDSNVGNAQRAFRALTALGPKTLVPVTVGSATWPRPSGNPGTITTSWWTPSAPRPRPWSPWTRPWTATPTCPSSGTWRTTRACTAPT